MGGYKKMANQTNWVQVSTLIVVALVLVGGVIYIPTLKQETPDFPTAQEIAAAVDVPTAQEIAGLIKIPDAERQKVQEAWEKLYADEINALEEDAITTCTAEFDWDEVVDLVETQFGNTIDVRFVRENEDDRDINVLNLGLNDEDDRKVDLSGNIVIEYKLEEGEDTWIRDKVYLTCAVTSDEDLEAELTYRV